MSPNPTGAGQNVEPAGSTIFFWSLAALLLFAPLFRAGNRPLPLLLLELGAVALLFVLFTGERERLALPRLMWTAILCLLAYPLVQLVPLPHGLWQSLPGHAEYQAVLSRFAVDSAASSWRSISVVPSATEFGWLALLPPLACLLAMLRLSPARVAQLLLIMSVYAGLEALLGLLQIGGGIGSALYLGTVEYYGAAIGTFVNRNHLAAMLAMTLPVIVGLLVFSMRPGRRRRSGPKPLVSEVVARRLMLFGAGVLILVCLLFTRSRAGIGTSFVGLAFSAIVLVRARAASEGTRRTRFATYLVLALVAVSILIAIVIGIAPILDRWDAGELRLQSRGRLALYAAALQAGLDFLPFGSGLSTFADVFPRFQLASGMGGYVDYAHNDYLQAFVEMGLVGPVVIALLLAAYFSRMVELLWREGGRSFTLLQLGAGVGLMPMILHSLFDFALHIPANAMWFATLAGVMFHKGVAPREAHDTVSGAARPAARLEAPLGPAPELPHSGP